MSTTARLPPSIEELTKRRDRLVAELALLEASRPTKLGPLPQFTTNTLKQLAPQPNNVKTNSRLIASLPGGSGSRAGEVEEAAERARRYRLTGRTVFGVELARGKRARQAELKKREKAGVKGKGKESETAVDEFVRRGVAVRLETFWKGRFFEPFYLVFDRVRATDDDEPRAGDTRLQLVHHTIPPFIPLRQLSIDYLGVPIRGQSDLYAEERNEVAAPSVVAKEADLDLFLTRLQVYLDAFVARRQQLEALRVKYSQPQFNHLRFAIFASTAADRVHVEWDLPDNNDEDEADEDEEGESSRATRSIVLQLGREDVRSASVGASEDERQTLQPKGAALLIRHVVQSSVEQDSPPHAQIIKRGARPSTGLSELIESWIDQTTAPGWTVDDALE